MPQTSHKNLTQVSGTAWSRRMTAGDLQAAQPTWLPCFSKQGVLISVKVFSQQWHCWLTFSLWHTTAPDLFLQAFCTNPSDCSYICLKKTWMRFIEDYLCDVFIARPSFTSSASLISTLPSASSKSLRKQKYWTELVPGQTFSKPYAVRYPIRFWK